MYYCLHYILPRILHIISRKCWYSMQINLQWWAIPKICVYLISRFYSDHESHKNLMLTIYTCFTVCECLAASADILWILSRISVVCVMYFICNIKCTCFGLFIFTGYFIFHCCLTVIGWLSVLIGQSCLVSVCLLWECSCLFLIRPSCYTFFPDISCKSAFWCEWI